MAKRYVEDQSPIIYGCSNDFMAFTSSASIPGSIVVWPAFSTMTSLDLGSFLWSL